MSKKQRSPRRNATRKPSSNAAPRTVIDRAAARPADGEAALKAVFDAGLKPEELPGLIAGSLMREVTECRTALSAEVALSGLMGMARLACPPGTSWDEQSRYVDTLMGDVTVTAYEDESEDALALLRVIAVLGGPTVSKRARAAAERLAAAGVPDRPWVRVLGRPTFVGAWR